MIQNNLQGILGNCKEKCKFHSSGYYKRLKQKMAVKTCIQQNMQYIILKAECTHRGTKNCMFGDKHNMFAEQ